MGHDPGAPPADGAAAPPDFDLPNLRDIGGPRTVDGRRVRRGRVFRAPALAGASPRDLATLGRLGLRTVVDLRSAWERERAPEEHLLPATARYLVVDVNGGNVTRSPMWQLRALRTVAERQAAFGNGRAEAGFEAKFRDFVAGEGPRQAFGRLLASLSAPDGLPAVFHCSTGKDRTGWAAAVLLSYLGVPEDAVMADYLAGNAAIRTLLQPAIDRHVAEGGGAGDLDALIAVQPSYLRAGLDEVALRYGTVARYVEEGLGLGRASGEGLRVTLLEPAGP
jgi:protein-tyrosine phosphatase